MDRQREVVSMAQENYLFGFAREPSYFGRPGSIIESAKGSFVTDLFGNRLLDTETCASACYLGFNLEEVMEPMRAQMDRIATTTPLFMPTEPLLRLAARLAQVSPGDMKYTVFGSNGTDANEGAVKIARQYWKSMGQGGRYKVLHRYPGDYHGISLAMTAASGHTFRRQPYEPMMGGFVALHAPNCYRCPFESTYADCGLLCARELQRVIEFEDPSTIACFITECTNTGLGIIPPPLSYMKRVREICDEYQILMVVDEVITGIAKTGTWFESEKYGIVPDMLTVGKAISAGYGPLAATHLRPHIGEVFAGKNLLHHGFTFGGMSYLAAAGLAGFDYVERHGLVNRAQEIGSWMGARLRSLATESPVVGDIRINGALQAVELVKDRETKEKFADPPKVAEVVAEAGREHNVLLNCQFTQYGNIIVMFLPLTISDDELEMVAGAIEAATGRVEREFAFAGSHAG